MSDEKTISFFREKTIRRRAIENNFPRPINQIKRKVATFTTDVIQGIFRSITFKENNKEHEREETERKLQLKRRNWNVTLPAMHKNYLIYRCVQDKNKHINCYVKILFSLWKTQIFYRFEWITSTLNEFSREPKRNVGSYGSMMHLEIGCRLEWGKS